MANWGSIYFLINPIDEYIDIKHESLVKFLPSIVNK